MHTREELKEKALKYIEDKYSDLISTIEEAMNKAAENGHLCLAHYAVDTEDEARGMERYFDAKGFSTESSWTKQDRETGELYGWYVNIFWW